MLATTPGEDDGMQEARELIGAQIQRTHEMLERIGIN